MQPLWLQIIFSWHSEKPYEEVSSCCLCTTIELCSSTRKVMMHSAWVDIWEREIKGISDIWRGGSWSIWLNPRQHDLPLNQTWMVEIGWLFQSPGPALSCFLVLFSLHNLVQKDLGWIRQHDLPLNQTWMAEVGKLKSVLAQRTGIPWLEFHWVAFLASIRWLF